ncbi:MAG: hypothetical protein ACQETV_04955 [Actinomycetota bacterium]
MTRHLIVANQTLGGARLRELVLARHRAGPATFHVVVPATPTVDDVLGAGALYGGVLGAEGLALPLDGADERTIQHRAEARLADALGLLADCGVDATGAVADPDPLSAIADALDEDDYDEIILSTLPPGLSRWLRMDLVTRAQRRFDVPVVHVPSADADEAIGEEGSGEAG